MVPKSLLLEATAHALIGHLSRHFKWVSPVYRIRLLTRPTVRLLMGAEMIGKGSRGQFLRLDYMREFDAGDPRSYDELSFQVEALQAFERREVAEHWMGDDV